MNMGDGFGGSIYSLIMQSEEFTGNLYLSVSHPTTRLDLVGIQSPKLQLLLEQRAADVGGVMKLSSSENTN